MASSKVKCCGACTEAFANNFQNRLWLLTHNLVAVCLMTTFRRTSPINVNKKWRCSEKATEAYLSVIAIRISDGCNPSHLPAQFHFYQNATRHVHVRQAGQNCPQDSPCGRLRDLSCGTDVLGKHHHGRLRYLRTFPWVGVSANYHS